MAVPAVTLSYRRGRCQSRDWSVTNSMSISADKFAEPITINIGGKKYETYEHTLNQFPNTLLGNPEKRKRYYDEKKKEFFFDRHRCSFTAILYYYQSGGMMERPLHVPLNIFLEELNFFQLSEEIQRRNEEESSCNAEEDGVDEEQDYEDLPNNKTLREIWIMFENPNSSSQAKCLAIFSLFVIILSIVIFCVETMPVLDDSTHAKHYNGTLITSAERGKNAQRFFVMNAICSSWFTLEYLIRFIASPNKLKFLKGVLNILDFLSILPFYVTISVPDESAGTIDVLRVMRVIRVCRVFKLTRHSKGLHILGKTLFSSLNELFMLMLFLVIGVVLFASAAYYAEEKSNPKFASIPDGFWWAVVTMTTVGYGDMYPVTTVGKLVGALCALSGVLAIALPVPVIVSNFEYYYKLELSRKKNAEETISYRNLEKLILKSPMLERKVLGLEKPSSRDGTPDGGTTLDVPPAVFSSPVMCHQITNGAMKFTQETIIEGEEWSHSSEGSSKPSTPKARKKQSRQLHMSETIL